MAARDRVRALEAAKARRHFDDVVTAELAVFKELGYSNGVIEKIKLGVTRHLDREIQCIYARYVVAINQGARNGR